MPHCTYWSRVNTKFGHSHEMKAHNSRTWQVATCFKSGIKINTGHGNGTSYREKDYSKWRPTASHEVTGRLLTIYTHTSNSIHRSSIDLLTYRNRNRNRPLASVKSSTKRLIDKKLKLSGLPAPHSGAAIIVSPWGVGLHALRQAM